MLLRLVGRAAAALSLLATPALAQTARLGGVVHDSVSGRDLSGALVWLAGTDRSAVTDSLGRWTLGDVPAGRVTLTYAHPALDSLGLTDLRVDATLAAGETHTLTLAGPSFATFASRLCGAPPADGGIVFGSVSDTRGTLFEGAQVSAEWTRLVDPRDPRFGTSERRVATSDGRGMYAMCGVVVDQGLTLLAATDQQRSGRLDVLLPATRLLRQDLMVGAATGLTGPAVLQGVVRDSAGAPVAGARIAFGGGDAEDDAGPIARTDAAGRFTLAGLPEGTQMVDVMAIGFSPERRPVDLSAERPAEVAVTLRRARLLATVSVTAAAVARFHQGLETRRLRGFGTVLTREQLDALPDVGAAIRMVPRVLVGYNRGSRSVAFRQGISFCQPDVYVDGMRVEQGKGNAGSLGSMSARPGGKMGNLDQLPPPQELAALEVYTRPSAIPYELNPGFTECGAIYAWTKQYAERGGR